MLIFDGRKLKKLRTGKSLTQEQLGLLIGKKKANVSHYEKGISTPPSDALLNLMAVLEVSAKDLSRSAEGVK